jgi:hypothetical protein
MPHRYKVGQSVVPRFLTGAERQDVYAIIRCLPDLPEGEPLYRIRSTTKRAERVVRESEIKPAAREDPHP